MDNYTRLQNMLAGISRAPSRAAESEQLKVVIDMLWQKVPPEKEREFFAMLEIVEVEQLADSWYNDK